MPRERSIFPLSNTHARPLVWTQTECSPLRNLELETCGHFINVEMRSLQPSRFGYCVRATTDGVLSPLVSVFDLPRLLYLLQR